MSDYTELIVRLHTYPADASLCDEYAEAMLDAAEAIEAQAREIERLTACLKTANSNHEHFEREWHLRGDEIEALRADAEQLRVALGAAHGAVLQCSPCLMPECHQEQSEWIAESIKASTAALAGKAVKG